MARGEMIVNPEGMRTGPVLEAHWHSSCQHGDTIDPGEMIVRVNGENWHKECAVEAGYQVPPG